MLARFETLSSRAAFPALYAKTDTERNESFDFSVGTRTVLVVGGSGARENNHLLNGGNHPFIDSFIHSLISFIHSFC